MKRPRGEKLRLGSVVYGFHSLSESNRIDFPYDKTMILWNNYIEYESRFLLSYQSWFVFDRVYTRVAGNDNDETHSRAY